MEHAATTLAAFRCNNFGILDDLHAVVAGGCYPNAALLNHSCTPNCVLVFRGTRLLRSRRCSTSRRARSSVTRLPDLLAPTATPRLAAGAGMGLEICECSAVQRPSRTIPRRDRRRGGVLDRRDRRRRPARDRPRAPPAPPGLREEEDDQTEWALVQEGAGLLRLHLHPYNAELAAADRALMTVALACGDVAAARDACLRLCEFLSAVLTPVGVYAHPLSALQQFTLADLRAACGNTAGARTAMALCIRELGVTHAAERALREEGAGEARRAKLIDAYQNSLSKHSTDSARGRPPRSAPTRRASRQKPRSPRSAAAAAADAVERTTARRAGRGRRTFPSGSPRRAPGCAA